METSLPRSLGVGSFAGILAGILAAAPRFSFSFGPPPPSFSSIFSRTTTIPLALSTLALVVSPCASTSSALARSFTAARSIWSAMNAPVDPAPPPPGTLTPYVSRWYSGFTTPRTADSMSSPERWIPVLLGAATVANAERATGARRPSASGGSESASSISRHAEGATGAPFSHF